MGFHLYALQINFHMGGGALGLALIERFKATRQAVPELPCASVTKRVFVQNLPYEV